ncbi:MAG: FAD-dependent oxidoreductase [Leptospiraceae bacterium]|nr:FAD-dependent oxidoreductase [Leptospiraceae bacterium]MDW7975699.1 FAD-dependent oxidoreductase [Leptospiraceae bacterium]
MKKIAVIGSGISGLGAAYYLSKEFDVTIFEKENYLGGHTNTIEISNDREVIPVDTGFIVFNFVTYPNLVNLFRELEVEAVPSNMSFSVWNQNKNLYYSTKNFSTIFAQRKNLFNPSFLIAIKEILRFNKICYDTSIYEWDYDFTLGDFLKEYHFSKSFIENYLIPMTSAIWSTNPEKILEFPIRTLIQFFNNHGLSSINGQHQWYTVKNGSYNYIKKIINKTKIRYFLNEPIISIIRNYKEQNVWVQTKNRKERFDYVVIATHAPTALEILQDATPKEIDVLQNFKYQKNIAILHRDVSVMNKNKKIWSAWNYKIGKGNKTSTTYYMTKLQPWLKEDIFVSVNEFQEIREEFIYKVIEYEHPVFDSKALKNQLKLQELNTNGLVYFCGAYFRYGFHEDGLISALDVVKRIKTRESLRKKLEVYEAKRISI